MGRQAEELAVQYETEQKEAEIKIRDQHIGILQQADLLQKSNLHSARFARDITIAGIILSLAIAGLLFRLYKQKQATTYIIGHKNEQLESLLTEKDWLLREVHHRVKNNLQTIISLLESQSRYLSSEALEAVGDSRRRIYAMSLLHQKI
jgi:two-component sensor histidine kinase